MCLGKLSATLVLYTRSCREIDDDDHVRRKLTVRNPMRDLYVIRDPRAIFIAASAV